MKKALRIVLIYLLFIFFGLFFGTFLFSLYLNISSYVVGREIKLFNINEIIQAFFFVSYCVLFLICPLIAYYRIRRSRGLIQFITYIVLSLITWLLLFPAVTVLESKVYSRFYSGKELQSLSSGYFRQADNKIYYFTKEFSENDDGELETVGVIIDTDEKGKVSVEKFYDSPASELSIASYPYREMGVKDTFSSSRRKMPFGFDVIINMGKESLKKSYIYYLSFVAFGLLMASLWACTEFFEWKLMNSALLMLLTALSISMNTIYFYPVLENVKSILNNVLPFKAMTGFCLEPVLFVVNVLCSMILIVIGIVTYISKNRKNSN